jgi:hypothetical protein
MTSRQPAPELQRCISAVLAGSRSARRGPKTGLLVCAGVAAFALSPLPATALNLGELATTSRLGQPLTATIPVRLAAGEMLDGRCVSRGSDAREVKGPQGLRFSVPAARGPGNFEIAVSTARPLIEPMYEISVRIDCEGTPRLLRHYVLMLDLPGLAPVLAASSETPAPTVWSGNRLASSPTAPVSNARAQPRLTRSRDPIAAGSSYRVREGDTLSTIADRIEGRPANSTWQLVDQIFAANPSAFIHNDPNLIKLGAEIGIPELGMPPAVTPQPSPALASTPVAAPAAASKPPAPIEPVAAQAPLVVTTAETVAAAQAAITASPDAATSSTAAPAAAVVAAPAELPELRDPFIAPEITESPEAPIADESAAPPVPVVITESLSGRVSPLPAVLLGVLLGVALSIGLLRARVLERASELLRRGQRSSTDRADTGNFIDTDEWLDPTDTEVGELPVRAPAEETYVVEVAEPEPSEEMEADRTGDAFDPNVLKVAEQTAAEGLDAAAAEAEPSTEFADVFTDAMEGLPLEPDLPLDEPFAGTAATVEQPAMGPTEQLPHFNSSGLGFDEDAEAGELASLDADDSRLDEATLGGLETVSGDESRLSTPLKEALSLLEQDYEQELTASQAIDRKAIEQALSDEETAELERKLGS